MTWFYTFILIFSSALNAAAPIEGGKLVSQASYEYLDVRSLEFPGGRLCSGSRVSPTLILTAAHCVIDVNEQDVVTEKLLVGAILPKYGKVVKITPHPSYIPAVRVYKKEIKAIEKSKKSIGWKNPEYLRSQVNATLYDIAFIEVGEHEYYERTRPYLKIISPETKLDPRKKMSLAGYGANELYWNGKDFAYRTLSDQLQVAENVWENCPLNYFGNEVEALDVFSKAVKQHLKIKAKRMHTITNGVEVIETDGKGMILGGDSGSPSLERDVDDQFVITGVASRIEPMVGASDAILEIEVDGKKVAGMTLEKFPDDWGSSKKPDEEFDIIKYELQELDLLDGAGKIKSNVQIKRKYSRVTAGNYSDLSHPDNQSFIKSIMPAEKKN